MKNSFIILLFLVGAINAGLAQELSIFPGSFRNVHYQDSNKITKGQFESLIKTDEQAYKNWKKSKNHNVLFALTSSTGIGLGLIGNTWITDRKNRTYYNIGATCLLGAAMWFSHSSRKLRIKSILGYNERLIMTPTSNGLGLVFNF